MKLLLTQAVIDQAMLDLLVGLIQSFEETTAGCQSLTPDQRKSIVSLGTKNYQRTNAILILLQQHPDLAPRDVDVPKLVELMKSYDQIVYFRKALGRFDTILKDIVLELGGHLQTSCYDAYSIAKRFGKHKGIDALMKEIEKLFAHNQTPSYGDQSLEAITAATQKAIHKATQKAVDEATKQAIKLATEEAVKLATQQAVDQVNKAANQQTSGKNSETPDQ